MYSPKGKWSIYLTIIKMIISVHQKTPLRNGKAIHIMGRGTCNSNNSKELIFRLYKQCLQINKEV